jgi:hypothetical protein
MKTFKEMLSEAKDNKIVTVADLKKAIDVFDDLPQGKKSSEAKKIAKFAEKLGYTLKKKSILDLLDSKKENNTKDEPKKVALTQTDKVSKIEQSDKTTALMLSQELGIKVGKLRFGKSNISVKNFNSSSPNYEIRFEDDGSLNISLTSGSIDFNCEECLNDFAEISEMVSRLKKDRTLTTKIKNLLKTNDENKSKIWNS